MNTKQSETDSQQTTQPEPNTSSPQPQQAAVNSQLETDEKKGVVEITRPDKQMPQLSEIQSKKQQVKDHANSRSTPQEITRPESGPDPEKYGKKSGEKRAEQKRLEHQINSSQVHEKKQKPAPSQAPQAPPQAPAKNRKTQKSKNKGFEESPEKQQFQLGANAVLDNLATKTKRFFNALIDYTVGFFLAGFVVGFILGLLQLAPSSDSDQFYNAVGLISSFLYLFGAEYFYGKTLGKVITGSKVVTADGEKPSAGQILLRTLIRFIPFEAFSFLGKRPIGWHDKWSKTRVINA